jgi:hypothetical protein
MQALLWADIAMLSKQAPHCPAHTLTTQAGNMTGKLAGTGPAHSNQADAAQGPAAVALGRAIHTTRSQAVAVPGGTAAKAAAA